jgi:phospholipase C
VENGLASGHYKFLTPGGTGLESGVPDTPIPSVNNLAPGPFQLTSATLPHDTYTASPVHRFYQMWQQLDRNAALARETYGNCSDSDAPGVTGGLNISAHFRIK